jgi:hypothetical protein
VVGCAGGKRTTRSDARYSKRNEEDVLMVQVGDEPSLHCNACGREVAIKRAMGSRFRVCSLECVREMEWRSACSTLNKPYSLSPESVAHAKAVLGECDGTCAGNDMGDCSHERTAR